MVLSNVAIFSSNAGSRCITAGTVASVGSVSPSPDKIEVSSPQPQPKQNQTNSNSNISINSNIRKTSVMYNNNSY
jgi:hypothetical protein